MSDEALAAFMDVTGCGYDDAFHRLASCGGHLGKAVNRFFNADAGTSGTRRRSSPPPSPQLISSDDSDPDYGGESDGALPARAPVPARRRARGGGGGARGRSPPPSGSSPSVSRSDSKTARGGTSRRRGEEASSDRGRAEKKRRVAEDDEPRGGRKGSRRRRRKFRVDMFASSSDEEEKVEASANTCRRQRHRLNPKASGASAGEEEEAQVTTISRTHRPNRGGNIRYPESIFTFGSDDDMDLAEAPPASKSDRDALFRAPRGLAYKCGSLHGAKTEAARRRRWLLVNVQGLDMASLAQNRDVWGSDLVARCVRDHFVLWQADAGDVDGGGEVGDDEEEREARKVLCYYKVPHDRLPVVLVVDPVTGEAVERLHGTDPNDFLVSIGPYTDKKPEFPVVGAGKKSVVSAGAQQSNQKPPVATTAPTSRQEQAPAVRKSAGPAEPVAAAAAAAIDQQLATGEKVCKMRVRLPDGRVVALEFGSQRAVAALFAYCRSELGAGAAAEKPMRLLRFVGASREAIGDENASFESLGLHMSTVCVHLG